jgi:hypothetical protein
MSYSPVNQSARTTVLAAVGGLLLLVLLVAFAVGLPELSGSKEGGEGNESGEPGESGSAPVGELAPLPESLPGDLVSILGPDMPPEVAAQSGGVEQMQAVVTSATANLAEVFGEPTAFGIYGRADGTALLTLAVGPGEAGLFVPDGAPVSAEVQQAARANLELVEIGDAVCSVVYAQAIPAGQPVDPEEQPGRVHCQLADAGLLYDVTAQGIGVEETVAAAEAVRDAQVEAQGE